MGANTPKQFLTIGGRTVLERAIEPFESLAEIDEIIVVTGENYMDKCSSLCSRFAKVSKVVKGGIKGVLPVLIIMTVLSLAARLAGYGSVLGGLVGIFIIVMLPIGILTSYVLWKKGKIQVVDKEQK